MSEEDSISKRVCEIMSRRSNVFAVSGAIRTVKNPHSPTFFDYKNQDVVDVCRDFKLMEKKARMTYVRLDIVYSMSMWEFFTHSRRQPETIIFGSRS